ncbi:MAG: hypothetical protein EBT95_08950, partial [Verrucomicrobia bacterium]|nr:hypothetical protein [Verrucomicrobiota bacterium]
AGTNGLGGGQFGFGHRSTITAGEGGGEGGLVVYVYVYVYGAVGDSTQSTDQKPSERVLN